MPNQRKEESPSKQNKKETDVVFLKGRKVNLAPLDRGKHFKKSLRWVNDPDTWPYLANRWPISPSEEALWFERRERKDASEILLAIETKEGRYIGNIGLHKIDWISRTAVTGSMIGELSFRHKGYGTDAKITLLNYAFQILNLRKVFTEILSNNAASLRYAVKCGYQEEARVKERFWVDGQLVDQIILSVAGKDWSEIWQNYQKQ